jgi:hypothetical protein
LAGNAGLNVKPTDGLLSILNPLLGVANAGTPLNYSLNIVAGAMGAGLLNVTNTYSSVATVACSANNSTRMAGQTSPQSSSSIDQLTSPGSTDQLALPENRSITIEPNPTTDHFNIKINGSVKDPVSITVLDISGRVIEKYEKITVGTVLQIGYNWRSGIYFAEMTFNGQRKIIKIIKAN